MPCRLDGVVMIMRESPRLASVVSRRRFYHTGHRHGHPGDAARRRFDRTYRSYASRLRRVVVPRARVDVSRRRHPARHRRRSRRAPPLHGQRRELNRRPADSNAHLTPFSQRLDCLAERRRQRVPATAAVAAPTATAAASRAAFCFSTSVRLARSRASRRTCGACRCGARAPPSGQKRTYRVAV